MGSQFDEFESWLKENWLQLVKIYKSSNGYHNIVI